MARISIEKTQLSGADQLATFLQRRMAEVVVHTPDSGTTSGPIDAFVCSSEFAEAQGGKSAIIEMARGMKAAKVLLISADKEAGFSVTSELRGAVVSLNMAASDLSEQKLAAETPDNYSLQMAVSLQL